MKSLFQNAVVKNAGWIMFGRIAQMLINLIVGLMTARYLGPSNYGLINYATAYTAFFMAFCTLGINSVLVKEFVDYPDDEGKIIGSTLVMRAISSFCSAIIIILLVSIIDADEEITIIVTSLSCVGLFFQIFETINYWFQSKLKSKISAFVTFIAYIVTAIYKIVLLFMGKSVEWFAFATSVDYICIGILLLFSYKRYGGRKLVYSREVCKRILAKSVPFILPSLMVSIYGYTDKFMLKQMLSEIEVGYYSTATTICGMWCFVLTAIIDSVYPTIMSAYKKSITIFEKRNKQLYAIIFYVSVLVSLIICSFGKIIVNILYGPYYTPSVSALRVVTWYTSFSYLGVARNAWIVCENKQKYLKYIYISAAICNILMNLVLIPKYGIIGAALASLLTQIFTTIIVPNFIKPIKRNSQLMLEAIMLKDIK